MTFREGFFYSSTLSLWWLYQY